MPAGSGAMPAAAGWAVAPATAGLPVVLAWAGSVVARAKAGLPAVLARAEAKVVPPWAAWPAVPAFSMALVAVPIRTEENQKTNLEYPPVAALPVAPGRSLFAGRKTTAQ